MDPDITGDAVEAEFGKQFRQIAGRRFPGQDGTYPDHAVQVKSRKSGAFACSTEIGECGTGFGCRSETFQKFVQFIYGKIGFSVNRVLVRTGEIFFNMNLRDFFKCPARDFPFIQQFFRSESRVAFVLHLKHQIK